MKVHYLNSEITDDVARITFIGRDARGKTRRPVIELDPNDFVSLIWAAKSYRDRQTALAAKHAARATAITTALQESIT